MAARNNKDLWAGLMLAGTGTVSLLMAREYPLGTALRMGPGYFPRALGALLILLGLSVALTGLRRPEPIQGGWSLRALILLPLSMLGFGVLVEHAGFVPAIVALVAGSAAAGREFKLVEVVLLTAVLTALSVAVFVWALGLPYPLIKGF